MKFKMQFNILLTRVSSSFRFIYFFFSLSLFLLSPRFLHFVYCPQLNHAKLFMQCWVLRVAVVERCVSETSIAILYAPRRIIHTHCMPCSPAWIYICATKLNCIDYIIIKFGATRFCDTRTRWHWSQLFGSTSCVTWKIHVAIGETSQPGRSYLHIP